MRVLDLTRVIAGPVATRTLALLGADVLRVDCPRLPESADAHADTGMGKCSTLLDLSAAGDRRTFADLLGSADVVILGYRPGALEALGLDTLLARRPGLVVAQLCAWGWSGPWAVRRGFDSLAQLHGIRPAPVEGDGYDSRPWLGEAASPYGRLRHALPPIHYQGVPRTWSDPPTLWGADLPVWTGRAGEQDTDGMVRPV